MLFWIFDWRHQIGIREILQLNSNICSIEIPVHLFSCEFCQLLRTPYLQNTSEQLVLDFFIHLIVFATQWSNRNQVFSIFEPVLWRVSNMMNIIKFLFGKLYLAKQTTQLFMHGSHLMVTHIPLGDHMELRGDF